MNKRQMQHEARMKMFDWLKTLDDPAAQAIARVHKAALSQLYHEALRTAWLRLEEAKRTLEALETG